MNATSKKERTKELIIQQAADLFNQKGYEGTSLNDIINATGLTKGALYGNFENKESIAIACFKYAVAAVVDSIRSRTKVIDNSLDKLKSVVYFYKERVFNMPVKGGCPILNTSIEADDNVPFLKESVKEAINAWLYSLSRTIEKGIENNEIDKKVNPTEFASIFISTLEGGIMMSRINNDKEVFGLISAHLVRMIEELKA